MPFFLVVLLIVLVLYISSHRKSKDQPEENQEVTYLKEVISELTLISEKTPKKTVTELLIDYTNKLKNLNRGEKELEESKLAPKSLSQADVGVLWSSWYSNNSISLLLYIGAFLIVASASAFVGFQWGVLSGTIKASVLTLVATAFFGFGIWFFNIPKIRHAGNTFIGIGALLIPVCGSAWYNFVFKDLGTPPGPVWFTTSLISLLVYGFLTYQLKNKFYTYISSLASLSLTFSLVNTFNLDSNFYILASIFTSFILLLSSFLLKNQEKEIKDYVQLPLEISSQIMMPITLVYGLFIAVSSNRLDSLEAMLSIFLASGFYILSYLHFKKSWNIALAELLFSFGVVLFINWQKFDNNFMIYGLSISAVFYLYISYFLRESKLFEEQDVSLTIGFIQLIFTFLLSFLWTVNPLHHSLIPLTIAVAGIWVAYLKKEETFIGISSISSAIFLYFFYFDILKLTELKYLGIIYFLVGLAFYLGLIVLKKRLNIKQIFGLSTVGFFIAALLFAASSSLYLLVLSFWIGLVAIHAALEFEKPKLFYISNIFLTFSLFNFLSYYNVDDTFRPFFYTAFSVILYGVSVVIPRKNQEFYSDSALVLAVLTPLFFGLQSFASIKNELQRSALITAYAATTLFSFDFYLRKRPNFGYITSALAMFSYIWQIHYLGITENLAYTIPLGVYFLILAYTRKIKDDEKNRNTLDLLGMFFLLTPSFFLSFGSEAMKYSVTLGLMGIILLAAGITLSNKFYRYGGVAGIVLAVFPQTYNYILALPRWVGIGIVGILFLSVAMYLLIKRKE